MKDRLIPFKVSILAELFNPVECEGAVSEAAIKEALEPIEVCKHPEEKIRWKKDDKAIIGMTGPVAANYFDWQCECGAKVKPASFEVIE